MRGRQARRAIGPMLGPMLGPTLGPTLGPSILPMIVRAIAGATGWTTARTAGCRRKLVRRRPQVTQAAKRRVAALDARRTPSDHRDACKALRLQAEYASRCESHGISCLGIRDAAADRNRHALGTDTRGSTAQGRERSLGGEGARQEPPLAGCHLRQERLVSPFGKIPASVP